MHDDLDAFLAGRTPSDPLHETVSADDLKRYKRRRANGRKVTVNGDGLKVDPLWLRQVEEAVCACNRNGYPVDPYSAATRWEKLLEAAVKAAGNGNGHKKEATHRLFDRDSRE